MSLLDNLKHAVKESENTRKDWRSMLGAKKGETAKKMSHNHKGSYDVVKGCRTCDSYTKGMAKMTKADLKTMH